MNETQSNRPECCHYESLYLLIPKETQPEPPGPANRTIGDCRMRSLASSLNRQKLQRGHWQKVLADSPLPNSPDSCQNPLNKNTLPPSPAFVANSAAQCGRSYWHVARGRCSCSWELMCWDWQRRMLHLIRTAWSVLVILVISCYSGPRRIDMIWYD